jgi:homoserine O-acetyltransferase/O-succinyltransferase
MRLSRVLLLTLSLATLAGRRTSAQTGVAQGDFVTKNFRFENGETLPELKLHWRTLGTPRKDARGVVRNAVLVLHGTGGTGAQFLSSQFASEMYGPGQPFDTTRFYVILPDDVGHGGSSKPSDGLHARFPRYGYTDMVRAEHLLVSEGLKVNHLRAILGTSMGCMHAWMWGEAYPDFMDGLVPLACAPTQIAGRNRMMRQLATDAIRTDPAWNGGEYITPPVQGLRGALEILWVMGTAPLYNQTQAPTRDAADSMITRYMADRLRATDANDFLYQFESSRDYDPSAKLESISAPVLAINSADDEVNPPSLGLMEKLMPRVKHGRYVLIPVSERTRGHGTHTWAAVWKPEVAPFLASLPER